METITLLPDRPCRMDDRLTVTVHQIVEEWLPPDRRSVMLISLHMKTPEREADVSLSSDEPHLVWERYEFEYLGGWRSEVQLRIKRPGLGPQE
jgi:hypothetical protein